METDPGLPFYKTDTGVSKGENHMEATLAGRVAVVTGASRGLGRAIAVELASNGAFVAANYLRGSQEISRTIEMIEAAGGRGKAYPADIRKQDEVNAMFKEIYAEHKRVDILINNAGITRDGYLLMMPPESWVDLMDVHLNGVFYCTKAVLRQMCASRRGVIINIGSGSALVAMPGQVNYSASKAGLLGFSRSLAREVAAKGVRVLHLAPGFFDTDMTALLDAAFIRETHRMTPLRRWGAPSELADVVSYLVSDDASFIAGQTVVVDGGRGAVETEFGF
jgi:3-oxoacyl-[acyl-carrier protein] reductase